jgi:hypothetical protein
MKYALIFTEKVYKFWYQRVCPHNHNGAGDNNIGNEPNGREMTHCRKGDVLLIVRTHAAFSKAGKPAL